MPSPVTGTKQVRGVPSPSSYQDVAAEYYDVHRHPTCANFRQASARLLIPWLDRHCTLDARIAEVGAGMSLVLEYLANHPRVVSRILISDGSWTMLSYSRTLPTSHANLVVAAADRLPLRDSNLTVLVASLGDPFNTGEFWREVRRILEPGGVVLFTTPSYEWSSAFRRGTDANSAEFAARGRPLRLDSFDHSPS